MKNPFRSEAEAYRFVWLTLGSLLLIAIGSWINVWVGVAVFIAEAILAVWLVFFRGEPDQPERVVSAAHGENERRFLVIANETVGGRLLRERIAAMSAGVAEKVLVVSPALNSPLKHWVSDEDDARAAAQRRLDTSVASMRAAGIDAAGEIGDGDPLQAIEDAVRTFAPDEIVLSTHPEGRSHWLERGVVDRARERFHVPLTHVVVDLDAGDGSR